MKKQLNINTNHELHRGSNDAKVAQKLRMEKEFARFNTNSSAVPNIFTGGRINVTLLIRNKL